MPIEKERHAAHMGALSKAVKERDTPALKTLLDDPSVAAILDQPWWDFDAPAIVFAAGRGNREAIDLLLAAGADINGRSQWWAGGFSVLHHLEADDELVQYLISRGARLDAHAAAGLDLRDVLVELLDADPEAVDRRGPDGMTPMHFARTPDIARLLLDCGATLDIRDLDHEGTPAQWAIDKRPDVARFLIEQGAVADIFMHGALGEVEKVGAALDKNPELLGTLSSGEAPGGHVYAYTIGIDMPPLQVAARRDQRPVVDLLLERGCPVDIRNRLGSTALHQAAWVGHADMVSHLLERGADPTLRDHDHNGRPADWARHAGHADIAELLEQRGPK